jgi:hypothetical protein
MTAIIEGKYRWASLLGAVLSCASVNFAFGQAFPDPAQLPPQPATPDPLVMFDGRRVANLKQWSDQRRPELKTLFAHYMYGAMPPAPVHETFTLESEDRHFFGGKATKKEIVIHVSADADAPVIHLLLIIPNSPVKKSSADAVRGAGAQQLMSPVHHGFPVLLGLNFCGNHAVVADPGVSLPTAWMPKNCPGCVDDRATEAGRGTQTNTWAIEQSIARGYAVATFYCGDVEPDLNGAPTGLREWLRRKSPDNDCGAIAAWAWGLSRAVDYLVTDPDIDARRIAVTGHSRLGKTALLAAAFDERIAAVMPVQAGCGGTAPSRGKTGESVKSINTAFPHWFNDQFKKFNEQPDRLPFDQDCLMALAAPRPLLIMCAREDAWSNPPGQFEMLLAADPVYRFLGVDGLKTKTMPAANEFECGRLTYFIRPGNHSLTPADWKIILDFADREMR